MYGLYRCSLPVDSPELAPTNCYMQSIIKYVSKSSGHRQNKQTRKCITGTYRTVRNVAFKNGIIDQLRNVTFVYWGLRWKMYEIAQRGLSLLYCSAGVYC